MNETQPTTTQLTTERPPAPPVSEGKVNSNPVDIGFWALVKEDFRTHDREWLNQGFWALFTHRFGNWRMGIRFKLFRAPCTVLYNLMFKACEVLGGIMLPYPVKVGRRVRIEHFGAIILSGREIGNDVTIRQNTTLGIRSKADTNARPIIEDQVDIGCGAVILGQVRIGKGSIIGANAVVIEDVPPYSLVVGIPGKVVRQITPPQEDANEVDT